MAHAAAYEFEGQSLREEIANSVTHGVGAALSLAAAATLVLPAAVSGSATRVASFAVFGVTLFALYLSSAIYHGLRPSLGKRVFHILDHSAIFLLIAGTYTPVTLVALGGAWGYTLFAISWGAAALGVLSTACFFERARHLSLVLYVAMGWLIVLPGPRLLQVLDGPALVGMVAGGVFYTAGMVFYRARARFSHTVWHLFVLSGSACHVVMMLHL